jgi:excisionase family DNA binding protein
MNAKPPVPKRGFTYREAATYLGKSERYIQQLVKESKLAAKWDKSSVTIDVAELDRYFDSLPNERQVA